jgi:hypothetical protein
MSHTVAVASALPNTTLSNRCTHGFTESPILGAFRHMDGRPIAICAARKKFLVLKNGSMR